MDQERPSPSASEVATVFPRWRSDAQHAKSELALLQSNAQAAEEEVSAWASELARRLSTDPSVRLRPEPGTPPLIQLVDERTPLESLIETALASRAEIAARSSDVALYETRLLQARIRPLVPTISAGFSADDFGGGSNQVGYRFSHFSGRTDFDVLAVWTIQNFGLGNRAVQNKVRAEIGQAEASRAAMIEQVRREVAEALAQTKTSRLQMEIARRRVEMGQKAYRQDLLRTKDRLGHLIEVLSSLKLLAAARQDLVQAMVGYSQSQFQLYVASAECLSLRKAEMPARNSRCRGAGFPPSGWILRHFISPLERQF
jgi:outer membrane protein TolC